MWHAAHTGEKRKMYRLLAEEPEGKNYFEDLRITLIWILKKHDSSGSGKRQLGDSCEHSKNILSSI